MVADLDLDAVLADDESLELATRYPACPYCGRPAVTVNADGSLTVGACPSCA